MANWDLIKEQYLTGIPPRELAKMHNLSPDYISKEASLRKWKKEKEAKSKEIAADYEKKIEELTMLSLRELKNLIESESIKDADKNTAIRTAIEISGLKKDKKEIDLTTQGVEVIINQKPVK